MNITHEIVQSLGTARNSFDVVDGLLVLTAIGVIVGIEQLLAKVVKSLWRKMVSGRAAR